MSISINSRYQTATTQIVTDSRGTHQSVNTAGPVDVVFAFTYYQWTEYDTIDGVAYVSYGDGKLWWQIGQANPEILDWTRVAPGTVIRIPSVTV